MSAAIYLLWRRFGARSLYLTVSLGLILGGAIGNMIDRFRLQTVVDFVDVLIPVVNYDFPVFNVADSCASVGTLLIAAYLIAADARAARATRLPFDCTAYRP
jgi:signal peptidase II